VLAPELRQFHLVLLRQGIAFPLGLAPGRREALEATLQACRRNLAIIAERFIVVVRVSARLSSWRWRCVRWRA
jgi:hypothetical protein